MKLLYTGISPFSVPCSDIFTVGKWFPGSYASQHEHKELALAPHQIIDIVVNLILDMYQ
jgi:hypothetical protein